MKSAASKDFSLTSVKQGELMTVGTTFPTKPTDIFGRGSCEPPLTSSNRGESKCKNERLADSFPLSVCYFSIPRYSHPSLQTRRKSGRLIALRNWRRVLRRKTRRCGEKPESKALSKPTNTILPKSRESPETKSPIKDLKLYGQTHVAELVWSSPLNISTPFSIISPTSQFVQDFHCLKGIARKSAVIIQGSRLLLLFTSGHTFAWRLESMEQNHAKFLNSSIWKARLKRASKPWLASNQGSEQFLGNISNLRIKRSSQVTVKGRGLFTSSPFSHCKMRPKKMKPR